MTLQNPCSNPVGSGKLKVEAPNEGALDRLNRSAAVGLRDAHNVSHAPECRFGLLLYREAQMLALAAPFKNGLRSDNRYPVLFQCQPRTWGAGLADAQEAGPRHRLGPVQTSNARSVAWSTTPQEDV